MCQEIFRTQRLSDQSFGERGVVEITGIIGYYTLIGKRRRDPGVRRDEA